MTSDDAGDFDRSTRGPVLYGVDSMVFVYHFESNEVFGSSAGKLLRAAEEGRCHLVCSVLALSEILVLPKRKRWHDLCRTYREMFESFPNLAMRPMDVEVAEIASDLRAAHNIRTPDSIHIATAIQVGATAFISGDGRLKGIEKIRILPLDKVP